MKKIFCFLFLLITLNSLASEKDEVKKTVQEYMAAFLALDYEKMYSLSHPELLKKLKPMVLGPILVEGDDSASEKEIKKILSMLKVKSLKELRELSDKDFYFKFWQFMKESGAMDAFKLVEINNLEIKISKQEHSYVAVLSGKTRLLEKALSATRSIEIKKLDGRFLISDISKAKYKNNKFVLDKAGLEIQLPQSWEKNQAMNIEAIKKKYDLPPEKLTEIEEQLNAMLLSYSTYEPRERQNATIVISTNEIEDGYTLKDFLAEAMAEVKQTPMYKDAKIVENGCPKIKIKDYASLFIETEKFKQYTYVYIYKKKLISININTDKIKVNEIIDSISPLKEL